MNKKKKMRELLYECFGFNDFVIKKIIDQESKKLDENIVALEEIIKQIDDKNKRIELFFPTQYNGNYCIDNIKFIFNEYLSLPYNFRHYVFCIKNKKRYMPIHSILSKFQNLSKIDLYKKNPNLAYFKILLESQGLEINNPFTNENMLFLHYLFKDDIYLEKFAEKGNLIDKIDFCKLNPTESSDMKLFGNLPETSKIIRSYLVNSENIKQKQIDEIGKIIKENTNFSDIDFAYVSVIDEIIKKKIEDYIIFSDVVDINDSKDLKKLSKAMKKYKKLIKNAESIGLCENDADNIVYKYIMENDSDKKNKDKK